MNHITSLNSKLLATGKKYTITKSKSDISNETIDLTMILFVFGCFFVLMFIILVLNSDYENLDKYRYFSDDPKNMSFIDRLKTWFLCGQECKRKQITRNIKTDSTNNKSMPTNTNTTHGLNQNSQCWLNL